MKNGYIQINAPQPALAEATSQKNGNRANPMPIELALQRRNRPSKGGGKEQAIFILARYERSQETPKTCEQTLLQLSDVKAEVGLVLPRKLKGKVVTAQASNETSLRDALITILRVNPRTKIRENIGGGYCNGDGSFEFPLLNKPNSAEKDDLYVFSIVKNGYNSCNALVGTEVLYNISASATPVEFTLSEENKEEERDNAEKLGLLVETSEAIRRYVFSPRLMESLPVSGFRSFDMFALLAPGVLPPPQTSGGAGPGVSAGVGTAGQFSINGIRSRENNFMVDGSDNNDEDIGTRRQGFVALAPHAIEAIQELQVITALGDARFGRNIGGQINALTKYSASGVHASVYTLFTDRRLNARDFFDSVAQGSPSVFTQNRSKDNLPILLDDKPLLISNHSGEENLFTRGQAGITLDGKLKSGEAISPVGYFLSYERQRAQANQESHFAVPTVKQRGVFESGETGIVLGSLPSSATSLPGNAIFSLYPFPNNRSGPYGDNTYTSVLPADGSGSRISFKFDHRFNSGKSSRSGKWWPALLKFGVYGDQFSGRYNLTDEESTLPATGEALFSSIRPKVYTQNLAYFFNRALSNNSSDTIRLSFGRTRLSFRERRDPFLITSSLASEPFLLNAPLLLNVTSPAPGAPTRYISASSATARTLLNSQGIAPVTQTEQLTGPLGQVIIAGFSPIGVDIFNFPQARANNTFQIAHTLTNIHGDHIFTSGFDLRRMQINSSLPKNYRPLAVFGGLSRAETGSNLPIIIPNSAGDIQQQALTGATLAAAGVTTGLFQTLSPSPNPDIGIRFTQVNMFFQDEYRLAPRIRITLGMRYELNTVPHTLDGRIEKSFNRADVLRQVQNQADACKRSSAECDALIEALSSVFDPNFRASFGGDRSGFNPRVGMALDLTGDGKTALRYGFAVYNSPFQGIVISQSRNAFPDFAPLNVANFSPRSQSSGGALTTLFNLSNPLMGQLSPSLAILQPGSLNTLRSTNPIALSVSRLFPPQDVSLESYFFGLDLVLPQPKLKHPYAYQYGMTLERQFWENWVGAVSYVGTRGLKLLRVATPDSGLNYSRVKFSDVMPLGSASSDPSLPSFPFFKGTISPPGQARFITNFSTIARTFFESSASSIYNSLQVEARRRYRHHFQFGAALTYSHAIDDASDFFDTSGAFALAQNSFQRSERASSGFDIRLRSVTHFIWDIPFNEKLWYGGWQVSGIATIQSGQPFTVNSAIDVNRDGNLTDRLNTTIGALSGSGKEGARTQLQLAPGADLFSLLAPDGGDGVIGRNTFRAPGVANCDLAITKTFRFNEENRAFIRAEVFNLFNRTHFGVPVRILEAPAFGRSVSTTVPARLIQFSIKLSF
ncbi:MAG TPA: Plug domain-containing protein [Blastocatellia bacterium]|nr:Plug domain-containing protein [Blastocatellia bacterium]